MENLKIFNIQLVSFSLIFFNWVKNSSEQKYWTHTGVLVKGNILKFVGSFEKSKFYVIYLHCNLMGKMEQNNSLSSKNIVIKEFGKFVSENSGKCEIISPKKDLEQIQESEKKNQWKKRIKYFQIHTMLFIESFKKSNFLNFAMKILPQLRKRKVLLKRELEKSNLFTLNYLQFINFIPALSIEDFFKMEIVNGWKLITDTNSVVHFYYKNEFTKVNYDQSYFTKPRRYTISL